MRQISNLFCASLCVLFLICNISYGQVKIRERVDIEPPTKSLVKTGTTTTSTHTIRGVCPWNPQGEYVDYIRVRIKIKNECTGETVVSEFTQSTNAEMSLDVSTASQYTISIHSQTRGTQYDRSWYDQWFGNFYLDVYVDGEMYASTQGGNYDGSITINPWFSEISLGADAYELSCFGETDFYVGHLQRCEPIIGGLNEAEILNLSMSNGEGILSFYDNSLELYLGTSTTVNYDDIDNIGLRLDENYSEEDSKLVTVTAEMNGYETSEILNIRNYRKYTEFTISTEEHIVIFGDEPESIRASTTKGGYCIDYETLPAEIKYNLVITEGQALGEIGYKENGNTVSERGTELLGLDHYSGSGRLYFDYIPHGEVSSKQNVTIIVSTTDPAIDPVQIKVTLSPDPFRAYANPGVIMPGDITPIFIEFIDQGGTYRNFNDDHEFYIELWENWWFGDLRSANDDDDWWYFEGDPGPFSFVSYADVFEEEEVDEVAVEVYVETYIVFDDDGNPLPTKTLGKDKDEDRNLTKSKKLLPDSKEAKLRRQARAKLKRELQRNKGKGTVVYEKDNVKLVQHDQGTLPLERAMGGGPVETTSSTTVYTYFDIIITKEIEKDTFYVKADFEKETFSSGDTVDVIMKKLDKKGIEYNFDPETLFEVGVEFGCKAAYLLDENGERQDYVQSMKGPIRIIIAEDITYEFDIELRVGAHDDDENIYKSYDDYLLLQSQGPNASLKKPLSRNSVNPDDPGYCIPPDFLFDGHGIAIGKISEEMVELLLGETKYFGVQKYETPEKLEYKIVELPTTYGDEPNWTSVTLPEDWVWIKEDVWGNNPIEIICADEKSGVYWEKKWFDEKDESNNVINDNKSLDGDKEGMIRIIGRFWEENKEECYSVHLVTEHFHPRGKIKLKVIEPDELGDEYNTRRDCFNEEFQLDSTIIFYSGKYGIPPQLIKAMVHEESSFNPAYVYEPYLDMQLQTSLEHRNTVSENQYYITDANDEGDPSAPTDHRIRYWFAWHNEYPEHSGSIFDVWNANQRSYPRTIYSDGNDINVAWDEQFDLIRAEVAESNLDLNEDEVDAIALTTATERWPNYLRDTYEGGMGNYTAQTRIVASYGFMQMVYFYALTDRDYPVDDDHLPEYAMETDTSFKYGIEHLVDKVSDIEGNYNDNNSWTRGYEETLLRATIRYNGGAGYPIRVGRNISSYLPLRDED